MSLSFLQNSVMLLSLLILGALITKDAYDRGNGTQHLWNYDLSMASSDEIWNIDIMHMFNPCLLSTSI